MTSTCTPSYYFYTTHPPPRSTLFPTRRSSDLERTIKKPPRFGGMKTYNWEGVNPDGYFLDKLEPIPSALPSGLTPSQLDRKSGSAGMPRPISYAVFCLKKKNNQKILGAICIHV